ncbi:MAG: flagellar hook-length control protein FliK [Desulfotomaculum sp.]|nr:flagellar hook-length control protein FliK [Desulfotomaculum sp.]
MQVAVDALLQQVGGKPAGGGKNAGKTGQGDFMLALLDAMQLEDGQVVQQGDEKSAELQLLDLLVNLTASADKQQTIKQVLNGGEQAAELKNLLLEDHTGIKLPEIMFKAGANNKAAVITVSAVNGQQMLTQLHNIFKAAAAEADLSVQGKKQLLAQAEKLIAALQEKPVEEVQAVLQKELRALIKAELSVKGENQLPPKVLELLAVLQEKPVENVLKEIKNQLTGEGIQKQVGPGDAVNSDAVNNKQAGQVKSQGISNDAAAVLKTEKASQNSANELQGNAAKNTAVKSETAEKEMPAARFVNNPEADKSIKIKTQQQEPQSITTQPFQKEVSTAKPESTTRVEQLPSKLLDMIKEMNVKQQPNNTTMRFKLHPEHLGEVTIRLSCSRGEINAQFYTATVQAKEALEALLPQIRDALVQQQVKLTDANVYLGQGTSHWGGQQQGRSRGSWRGPTYGTKQVGAVPAGGNAGGDNNKAVDRGLNLLV